MSRPEWCEACARDQTCLLESHNGDNSCTERIALYDAGAHDLAAEVLAMFRNGVPMGVIVDALVRIEHGIGAKALGERGGSDDAHE